MMPSLPNAQVNPRVPTGDMIHQTRTAAHVGLNRLLGLLLISPHPSGNRRLPSVANAFHPFATRLICFGVSTGNQFAGPFRVSGDYPCDRRSCPAAIKGDKFLRVAHRGRVRDKKAIGIVLMIITKTVPYEESDYPPLSDIAHRGSPKITREADGGFATMWTWLAW